MCLWEVVSNLGGFSGGTSGREPGSIAELGRSPGEGHGNDSSTLAQRLPWTEEPGGPPSIGSQSWTRLRPKTTRKLDKIYVFKHQTIGSMTLWFLRRKANDVNPVTVVVFSFQTISGQGCMEWEQNRTLHFDELRWQRLEFRWVESARICETQTIGREGVMLRKNSRNVHMGSLESLVEYKSA